MILSDLPFNQLTLYEDVVEPAFAYMFSRSGKSCDSILVLNSNLMQKYF